jgi:hypothetical protein
MGPLLRGRLFCWSGAFKGIGAILGDFKRFRKGKSMNEENKYSRDGREYNYFNDKITSIEKLTDAKIERLEDSVKHIKEYNEQFLVRAQEKMDYHSERLDIKVGHVEELVAEIKQSNKDFVAEVKQSNKESTRWSIALVVAVILGIAAMVVTVLYSNTQIMLAITNIAQK